MGCFCFLWVVSPILPEINFFTLKELYWGALFFKICPHIFMTFEVEWESGIFKVVWEKAFEQKFPSLIFYLHSFLFLSGVFTWFSIYSTFWAKFLLRQWKFFELCQYLSWFVFFVSSDTLSFQISHSIDESQIFWRSSSLHWWFLRAWRHFSRSLPNVFRSFAWLEFVTWPISQKMTFAFFNLCLIWITLRSIALRGVIKIPNERSSVEWILTIFVFYRWMLFTQLFERRQ